MRVIPFMKYTKTYIAISAIIIILGLVFGIIHGGFNLGIDFTGGATVWAKMGKSVDLAQVREITDTFDKQAIITYAGQDKTDIVVKTMAQFDKEKRGQVIQAFKDKFGIDEKSINFDIIGPTIGGELRTKAVLALIAAAIGILIYVSFRFEWKFGVAGVAALIHDLLVLITVYLVLDIPVNSSFIAAVLTIVGYSINDTIVIFDRIRERIHGVRKYNASEIADESITQTLSRSINTVMTVVICVTALYLFGVPAIKEFALPLLVGIISGAYSSICIASPIWVWLKKDNKRPVDASAA